MSDATLIYTGSALGALSALAALTLRRAEGLSPAPGDIQTRTGLGHMMTGIFASAALTSILFVGIATTSAIILVGVGAGLLAWLRVPRLGTGLHRIYRLQLPLAFAGLILALFTLLSLLDAITGALNA